MEGEVIPLYEEGGTIMIKDPEASKKEEPEFMKYMKGVNLNFDDKAYM
jgi:hypothetical protein